MILPNPRRPHQFQTSDSRFEVRGPTGGSRPMFEVWEMWWYIDKHREEVDGEWWRSAYSSREAAEAARDRLSR